MHESERTRVTRLFYAGEMVIGKEPLRPDAERRVAHETAMLGRVRGLAEPEDEPPVRSRRRPVPGSLPAA